jgi:hypothetical protein
MLRFLDVHGMNVSRNGHNVDLRVVIPGNFGMADITGKLHKINIKF